MRTAPLVSTNINTWDQTDRNDPTPPNYDRVLTHMGGGTVPVAPQWAIQQDAWDVDHAPPVTQLSDYIDQLYGA